jgi:ABC-2 type transport system permease protein
MTALPLPTSATSAVARRASREGLRDPGPSFVIPAAPSLLMAVAFTALFERISAVIDFGTGSFAEYLVPGLVVFTALAGGGFTSAQLAADLRSGFMDRLRLYPGGLRPLLLGRFAFEAIRVLPAALLVLAAGVALGGTIENLLGIPIVALMVMGLSVAYAGIFLVVASITEDPQTPLNLQPVGIIFFFLSSAIVPLESMPAWAETASSLNPVTAIADGVRSALVGDLSSNDVAVGVAVVAVLAAASVMASFAVLHRQTARS